MQSEWIFKKQNFVDLKTLRIYQIAIFQCAQKIDIIITTKMF